MSWVSLGQSGIGARWDNSLECLKTNDSLGRRAFEKGEIKRYAVQRLSCLMALSWPSNAFRWNLLHIAFTAADDLGNLSSKPIIQAIKMADISIVTWIVSAIALRDLFKSSVLHMWPVILLKNRTLVERHCSVYSANEWIRIKFNGRRMTSFWLLEENFGTGTIYDIR